MNTDKLRALVVAVEMRSLSRAAARLGVRLSTISRQISDLEASLDTRLLVRTGRGVRPTPAGERFAERARVVLDELATATAEAQGQASGPTSLRLTAPLETALSLLPSCLAQLCTEAPDLRIDLHSEARRVALIEEDYDAALRLGELRDSSLVGKKLGEVDLVVCASPARGSLRIDELSTRPAVGVAGVGQTLHGRVRGKDRTIELDVRLRVSTFTEAAEVAARAGWVVLLPSYTAMRPLRDGRLVRVARALSLPPVGLHMVFDRRHRASASLRRLGDLVAAELAAANRAARKTY